jgi:ABC-2 type transport system permease protein
LGEKVFNTLLKDIITNYAYKEPPYPTSFALYDRVMAVTPDTFKYLVKDGLENIIVFRNEITEAKSVQLATKKFSTTIKFNIVKLASDPNAKETKDLNKILLGQSKEVAVNDYIDIALFDESDGGTRYGKKLFIHKYKINKKENSITIITDTKPFKAVLDPYFVSIHKDPEDNMKKVK